MKLKSFILIILLSLSVQANEDTKIYYGTILNIQDAMSYKYLKVNEEGKELWLAIANAPVKVGEKIAYDKMTIMKNFKSKSLKKTFKEIIFASDVYLAKKTKDVSPKTIKESPSDFVKKEFYTVEEVFMWRNELKDQTVTVKGKISKISKQIMKLDWVHIIDGTGNKSKQNNDLIFTTNDIKLKTEDKVIATGKVIVNKDFGYGYFYKVILQESSFKIQP